MQQAFFTFESTCPACDGSGQKVKVLTTPFPFMDLLYYVLNEGFKLEISLVCMTSNMLNNHNSSCHVDFTAVCRIIAVLARGLEL